MMKLPEPVKTAFVLLERAGYEAFLVGGAVRDFVRTGSPAGDWDITTSALPEQVQEVFRAYPCIGTGLKHGTVTVILDSVPLEITTYRVDGDYTDNRHPDSVRFTRSLGEDLARRDFTMNALAWSPKTGLVDLVGGKEDLERRLVRCVGEPDRRFREDALRILRGLRFASVFEMELEAETARAIHENRELLRGIAAERVRVELTKLLCGPGVEQILRKYADVLAVVLPELAPMFGLVQHNPHHDRDVWEHTIAVTGAIRPEGVLRWAALLHDAGKPDCFSRGEDGVGHFYGHAERSTELTRDILNRLRFDNAGKETILRLVRYHDMPIPPERKTMKRLLSKHGEETARQLVELHRADTLGLSPMCQYRLAEFEQVSALMDALLEEESCFSLKDLAVNGRDVMALGLRGREIGKALQACLDGVLEERIPNEREPLLDYLKTQRN